MLQHFGTAPSTTMSPVDENRILAEIEGFLSESLSFSVQKDGALVLPTAARQGFRPLLVVAGIAVVVALVPLGLKTGKAAQQAMNAVIRGPM